MLSARVVSGCTPIRAYSAVARSGRFARFIFLTLNAQQEKYYSLLRNHPPQLNSTDPVRRDSIGLPAPHSSPVLPAACFTPTRIPMPDRIRSQSLKLRS